MWLCTCFDSSSRLLVELPVPFLGKSLRHLNDRNACLEQRKSSSSWHLTIEDTMSFKIQHGISL